MGKKSVEVTFICANCGKDNNVTAEVETGDTVSTFNLRGAPIVEVKCEHCGSTNSVKVDA
jgi:DNA-directed RNA polymerase subunit RPC12/RpoP